MGGSQPGVTGPDGLSTRGEPRKPRPCSWWSLPDSRRPVCRDRGRPPPRQSPRFARPPRPARTDEPSFERLHLDVAIADLVAVVLEADQALAGEVLDRQLVLVLRAVGP